MTETERPTLRVLSTVAEVRALADPLRQRILQAFCVEPRTTKQVAELLGESPTRLYHHVDLLAAAGLIELTATRAKRGTVEKYYRAVAHRFTVDPALFAAAAPEGEGPEALALGAVAAALAEMREGAAAYGGEGLSAMVGRGRLRGTPEEIAAWQARLEALLEEIGAAEDGRRRRRDDIEVGIAIALYPLAPRAKRRRRPPTDREESS